jgi:hypothetical protein
MIWTRADLSRGLRAVVNREQVRMLDGIWRFFTSHELGLSRKSDLHLPIRFSRVLLSPFHVMICGDVNLPH